MPKTKRVRIKAPNPIPLKVVLRGNIEDILLTTDEIKTCITAKAEVDEILTDGSFVRLNFKNYDADNNKIKKEQLEREKLERIKKEQEEQRQLEQQRIRMEREKNKKEREEQNKQHNESNKQEDKK